MQLLNSCRGHIKPLAAFLLVFVKHNQVEHGRGSSQDGQGGDYFYLESDYDASIFLEAIGYEACDPRLDEIQVQNYTGRCFVSHLPCLRTTSAIKIPL